MAEQGKTLAHRLSLLGSSGYIQSRKLPAREVWVGALDFTTCGHKTSEGCYVCCERCNYDWHFCPGCGTPLPHRTEVCDACLRIADESARLAAVQDTKTPYSRE